MSAARRELSLSRLLERSERAWRGVHAVVEEAKALPTPPGDSSALEGVHNRVVVALHQVKDAARAAESALVLAEDDPGARELTPALGQMVTALAVAGSSLSAARHCIGPHSPASQTEPHDEVAGLLMARRFLAAAEDGSTTLRWEVENLAARLGRDSLQAR